MSGREKWGEKKRDERGRAEKERVRKRKWEGREWQEKERETIEASCLNVKEVFTSPSRYKGILNIHFGSLFSRRINMWIF